MVPSNLASLRPLSASLGSLDAPLVGYILTWSRIPLVDVQTDPFSESNLTPALRDGLENGHFHHSSATLFAASTYVLRARSYERILLQSLDLDAAAVDDLVDRKVTYGDHFSEGRYPWQDAPNRAQVVVSEMAALGLAIDQAGRELNDWKRTVGFYPDAGDNLNFRQELSEPMGQLQGLLERRVRRAQTVATETDLSSAEGLALYFQRGPRRDSGMTLVPSSGVYAVFDSTPPPAA